jgi:hypothetical protein
MALVSRKAELVFGAADDVLVWQSEPHAIEDRF